MRCDAVPGDAVSRPNLHRRAVILALSGVAALKPTVGAASTAASEPALADLVAADGSPSALAWSLAQTQASVRGYLAPSLDGREFTLTEGPALPCQLCGDLHGVGASVVVRTGEPEPSAPAFRLVQVAGRLEVDGAQRPGIRLTSARIRAA